MSSHNHEVFISHSSKNRKLAYQICHILEKNNLKCWISSRDIPSGRIYTQELGNAIRATKIVVLVFSRDAQASRYVGNEIEIAYEYERPIISFNIDGTLPAEEFEYYLKISQWLDASSNPEDHFEELVGDALRLCDIHNNSQVIVDLSDYREEDLMKHKQDYLSLILLFTPVYWASFFYMGFSAGRKMWIAMGFLYLFPTLMYLVVYFQILNYLFVLYPMMVLANLLFFIFWIFAVIHGLVIRKEFLTRKSVLRFASADDELFDYLYEEYSQL